MGRKLANSAPFLGRGAGSPSSTLWLGPRPTSVPIAIFIHPANTVPGAEAYLHSKWHLDASSRNKHGPKIWGRLRPLFGEGERGPHLTQSRLGRGLPHTK